MINFNTEEEKQAWLLSNAKKQIENEKKSKITEECSLKADQYLFRC